ncbi:glycosyltransferase family 4 protein [Paenibacillus sp. 19GGS1-52]|uniref:glycosyltransferase family 4 protein n=1 Tax=Paenibacillus sp. 19GGS1-52 TaxID=2758563 RepID=UPI001EFA6EA0|nr:glycosyltransferase family 4 protein [Paenibacillus sp. 19GGS1-52]ULO08038.1 glycosyltransferase family 4 protein [Paenibacillus sp. 19GGS1-52]
MKIAIVTPWFTDSISGGAERFAGGIAKSLHDAGCNVEILTTCGKDSFWDWDKNFFEEGINEINGLSVRRFPLRKRNKKKYEEILGKLLNKEEIKYSEEMQLFHETVNSDAMYRYITENEDEYIFLFIPYIFGTSYWGSKMVPERSFLIPCLHDEDMAYLESIGHMFARVKGILFNTIEEQQLTEKLHNIDIEDSVISGGGVELNYIPDNTDFRKKYGIESDYFIYVGRLVGGKNVPQMLEFFNRYHNENRNDVKLLVVGKGEEQIIETIKQSKGIIHMGELNDGDKFNAIAGSIALIQPSLMESFSIVIMESWLCETPVIVHEGCAVTKGHCDRSEGGFYYKDYESFKSVLNIYLSSKGDAVEIGKKGKEYVEKEYTWEHTAKRIIEFLNKKGFSKEDLLS